MHLWIAKMTIEIAERRTIYKGWTQLIVATICLPDGRRVNREIEDHGNAVCVLPYDPQRKTAILVRQFRAPVYLATHKTDTLEAIAGILEEPDAMAAARREANEEAGLRLGALEHVATCWTMPGISTEQMTLYLSCYGESDRIGPGGGCADEHECITAVEVDLPDLITLADTGDLADMKTFVLVQALKLRRPDLFAAAGPKSA